MDEDTIPVPLTIKKEANKVIPNDAKPGDRFLVSTGDHIRVNKILPDGRFDYNLIPGPIPQSKAVGTVTIPNDPKLNIPTGVKQLQEIQTRKEKSMANELDVTEVDRAKYEKIEKLKKRDEDVATAINIAASLKDDINKIKEELCVGPDCLKEQVKNKFGEIDTKIAKLDAKAVEFYSCDKCGYPNVPALSSFCPQCGTRIPSWNTDEGEPVAGWKPYYEMHKGEEE